MKEERLEIHKMLVLSTAHITRETAEKLENDAYALSTYPREEYGWFIYIPYDWDEYELPEDLKACIKLAKNNNCVWLCLDCDGLTTHNLPVYDW